jgi:hypothetical protein
MAENRVVIATALGYLAVVWVGTDPEAPVQVRNPQSTRTTSAKCIFVSGSLPKYLRECGV